MKSQREKDLCLVVDAVMDAVKVMVPSLIDKAVARRMPELSRALADQRPDDDETDNTAALARAERAVREAGARERAMPKVPERVRIEHEIRRAHIAALKRGGSR